MADRRRLVNIAWDGTVTLVRDLEDGAKFFTVQDSFNVVPGARKTVMATIARRYAGSIPAAETHENGSIEWKMLVKGVNATDVLTNLEALLSGWEIVNGQYIEWRPDGAANSTYFEIRGPATYKLTYSWLMFMGSQCMVVDITIPIAPLAQGDKQAITIAPNLVSSVATPNFEVDAAGWTFSATAGGVTATAARDTGWASSGGASYLIDWTNAADATVRSLSLLTPTGAAGIPVLPNTSYSVWFNANVAIALAAGNLRFRIFWFQASGAASAITPVSIGPTQVPSAPGLYTFGSSLTSPADAAFGRLSLDVTGFAPSERIKLWIDDVRMAAGPVASTATYDGPLPSVVKLPPLQGDAPALADISLTSPGGLTAAPIWSLIGWTKRPAPPLSGAVAPFGIIEAETGGSLVSWAVAADAAYSGGNGLKVTAAGAGTASAMFTVDPSTMVADDFTPEELDIEVWARVALDATIVFPQLTLSLLPLAGSTFGGQSYTGEFGVGGKLLTPPSTGTAKFRRVRLGVLSLPYDKSRPLKWNLKIAAAWATGSTGTFGLDRLELVPARQRAVSVSGKPNDTSFGKFIGSTAAATKTIRSDLSGRIASGGGNPGRDSGLGGSPLEFPPGDVDVLLSLSNLVADDPTSDATTDQLSWSNFTGSLLVTPRYWLARST